MTTSDHNGKTAFITGITGQDGRHLAELLNSEGYTVYGLVRGQKNPRRAEIEAAHPYVKLLEGDLTDMSSLSDLLMKSGRFQPISFLLTHYIPLAHVGGGFMMAIGLWTRTAIALNIPILFGAVFFVHIEAGLFTQNQGLEFTALVLFLLILLLIWGPGKWSVDYYLKKAGPPE